MSWRTRKSGGPPQPLPKKLAKLGEEAMKDVRAGRAREGWEKAFLAMAAQGDDHLLDPDATGQTPWDETEWEW